jgi:hypothetical protein
MSSIERANTSETVRQHDPTAPPTASERIDPLPVTSVTSRRDRDAIGGLTVAICDILTAGYALA